MFSIIYSGINYFTGKSVFYKFFEIELSFVYAGYMYIITYENSKYI